jgi:large subunit ribosomal protein L25
MAKPHTITQLTLEPREDVGTTAAHRIRREGKIPGVVYGHGRSTPISIEAKQLSDLILSGEKSKIVEASINGVKDSVLLRRVEAHPISRKALSVDFQRVAQGEAITASVNVVTVGVPIGVSEGGGVMDVITHSLDIKGPAQSIPDSLTVDVSGLDVHQHITAGQVPLPEGFNLLTPPETVIVSVEVTRALAADTDFAAGGAAETPAANGDAAPTA